MLPALLAALLAAASPGGRDEGDKKERWLADKRAPAPARRDCCPVAADPSATGCVRDPRCRPPLRAGAEAETVLYARHLHTLEVMPLRGPVALDEAAIGRFFRCRWTDEPAGHPPALVAGMLAVAEHFGARQIHIVSGFRHPKFNLMLAKKGREVARDSQHTRSQALDFSLPGVDAMKLYKHVLKRWKGGVGYYAASGFVHMDTGKRRTWRGT